MILALFIIFLLLLLNAFFALAEMAIVSARKPLLGQWAKAGSRGAALALALAENSGRFLSTVQVGITLVGTLAGTYGGVTVAENLIEPFNRIPFVNPHGEMVAVILVVTVLTYFSVVVGELVPKQLALSNPERIAVIVAHPMLWVSRLCAPFVVLLEASAKVALHLFGIREKREGVTEGEIKAVIAEGAAAGAIEPEEHEVIQRVIRLGDRSVTSIMTSRSDVVFVRAGNGLPQVRDLIARARHAVYPVTEGDNTHVLGVLEASDVATYADVPENFNVMAFMKEACLIAEATTCLEMLKAFKTKALGMALVVDERGEFQGLVTMADVLESIVGIMASNYDADEHPRIVQRPDGSWLVDGITPMDEANLTPGLEAVPRGDDYHTVAGFVLSRLQSMPAVGRQVEEAGYSFEIVDMDRHRIDKVLVTRQERQEEA